MDVTAIQMTSTDIPLAHPYRIANRTIETTTVCVLTITLSNGVRGFGAGAPEKHVTGETLAMTKKALSSKALGWLLNQSIYTLPAHLNYLRHHYKHVPAAASAVDLALHDAYAKVAGLPLVEILGREHQALPTSVTLGIGPLETVLKHAENYVKQGFHILKVKLGENLTEDLAVLRALRDKYADKVTLRADMNQGYDLDTFLDFVRQTEDLQIELIEQPLSTQDRPLLLTLPDNVISRIALDENVHHASDAFECLVPSNVCGIFNVKLMKCGGIAEAKRIAELAHYAGLALMWGSNDESRISIAGALHAAFSTKTTKYLDLDGSFDLAQDVVSGGFVLEEGHLMTTDKPGLGVEDQRSLI